jgi:hypothetical protein
MEKNPEDVGATAYWLPNSENPLPHHTIYYGDQRVPTPCNYKAEEVDSSKVMRQVLRAK